MPLVGVAAPSSLALRQLKPVMARRDLLVDAADRAYDVKTAFSSWDKCMSAAYCKWPVIAIIVVGSLILISIVWCVVRRLCCGLACCCGCFQCLKCCGNCCGCCDAPGRKKHKYLDEPYIPPDHGYQTQPPMHAPAASNNPPRYAEFDMARKGGEDSLPEMPSWESGSSKHVKLDDEVEMSPLNQPSTAAGPPATLASGPASHMGAGSITPHGPRGPSPTSYMQTRDGYGQLSQAVSRQNTAPSSAMDQRGYRDYASSPDTNGYGYEQPYAGYAAAPGPAAYRRQMSQGFEQDPAYPVYHEQQSPFAGAPAGYGIRRQGTGDSGSVMGARSQYGADSRSRASLGPRQTPRPRGDYPYTQSPRATPGPHGSGYRQPSYEPTDYHSPVLHQSPPRSGPGRATPRSRNLNRPSPTMPASTLPRATLVLSRSIRAAKAPGHRRRRRIRGTSPISQPNEAGADATRGSVNWSQSKDMLASRVG